MIRAILQLTILSWCLLTACTPPSASLMPVRPLLPPEPQCRKSLMLPVTWQGKVKYCLNDDQDARNLLANQAAQRACFADYSAYAAEVRHAIDGRRDQVGTR